MHAEVISIRSLTNYEEKLHMVWKSRLRDWSLADIRRGGSYLRGIPSNLRPHRHPRMILHQRWYQQLEIAYKLKIKIDMVSYNLKNPYF